MGIDEGFDLYPPLQNNDSDNERWVKFLEAVITHYEKEQDKNMTVNTKGNIVFTQGEHPTLLREGHRFRRFSSKISGSHAGNVSKYLEEVTRFARQHFGSRVKWWSELSGLPEDRDEMYTWDEVYKAIGEDGQ